MKQPNDLVRLQHMLEAAEKAIELVASHRREDLQNNETITLALTRLIEILGEAASRVTPALRDSNPQIPWKQVIGARHHLIHGYFSVDLDIVWQIVKSDLPVLVKNLKELVQRTK